MEQRAKGKRSLRNKRSEVQEEPAKGRASGAGAAGRTGQEAAAAPRHPERALHRRPHRPSAGPGPGSDREQRVRG